jgi:predicted GNAT family N-acyltransferase
MSRPFQFTVRRVSWNECGDFLRSIRNSVFIEEQNVPAELEWDGLDELCTHVIGETTQGEPIGTGRLLPDGHIGRMAVLKYWRGRGVGSAILAELIETAREKGCDSAILDAQTHALKFYARFGFEIVSDEFMDAGIPHRTMRVMLFTPKQE